VALTFPAIRRCALRASPWRGHRADTAVANVEGLDGRQASALQMRDQLDQKFNPNRPVRDYPLMRPWERSSVEVLNTCRNFTWITCSFQT